MIDDVRQWMAAAEQPNDMAQVCRQIGFVLEEMAELLGEIGDYSGEDALVRLSTWYKSAPAFAISNMNMSRKTEMLDAFLDAAWVSIGGAIAMGADVEGAWAEIVRSNNSKFVDGRLLKDKHGKVTKPGHYNPPHLTPYLKGADK